MKFKGIICALLTPFNAAGEIDKTSLRQHLEFLIESKVHGLFIAGTTGEGMLLSVAERQQLTEQVIEINAGRLPLLVHTGTSNTRETAILTKHAAAAGADGAGIVAPYFYSYDEQGLYRYFQQIAEMVPDFPLYLYNNPGNAKNDLKPALVQKLAKSVNNIVGIKDTSKDLIRFQDYAAACPTGFTLIVGSDSLVLPALTVGGHGVISAVANVFPELLVALYQYWQAGDYKRAAALQRVINILRSTLKKGPYLAAYKQALNWRGLDYSPVMCPPLRMLADEENAALVNELTTLMAKNADSYLLKQEIAT